MLRLRRRYFNVARQFDTLSKRLDLMGVVTCSQGSQEDPLIALSCGKKASSFVKDNWIPPCIDPQSKATLMLVDNQSANMNGNEKNVSQPRCCWQFQPEESAIVSWIHHAKMGLQ